MIYDFKKADSDPGGCPKWTFKMDEYLKRCIVFIAFGVHLDPITAFYGLKSKDVPKQLFIILKDDIKNIGVG